MINVINMINPSHQFHIDNNAPCIPYPAPPPPPKKKKKRKVLHNHCLRFLLGRLSYKEEIIIKGYAKVWGGGGGKTR